MSTMSETRSNVIFFMLLTVFAYAAWCVWDRALGPLPVTLQLATVLTPNVQPGESVAVLYKVDRRKNCGLDSSWIITDSKGNREREVQPHVDSTGVIGSDNFIRRYPIRTDMMPGPAKLVVVVGWSCPENVYENLSPKVFVNPPLTFTIVPQREGSWIPKINIYRLPAYSVTEPW